MVVWMRVGIEVLNGSGHLNLEWDTEDPDAVAKAREEVATLKAAGYSFFLADGAPADEIRAGAGHLTCVRVDDPILALHETAQQRPHEADTAAQVPSGDGRFTSKPDGRRTRGRVAVGKESVPGTAGPRVVAVGPMRGG